jgi:subtilisin-like proprotein convertase family protein
VGTGRRELWLALGAAAAALSLALPAGARAGVCETQKNNTDVPVTEGQQSQSLVTTIGEGGNLTDVDVHLDIVHPNPAQLAVYLQHATFPISPPIELTSGNGGGANYSGTILDDEALNPITGATAPFTGRYRPETPLSTFDGQGDGGAWTLSILEGGEPTDPDTGYLDSWGVTTSSDACDDPPPPDDDPPPPDDDPPPAGDDSSADCTKAKAKLAGAKAKLTKLKNRGASQKKVRSAKRAVRKAKAKVKKRC